MMIPPVCVHEFTRDPDVWSQRGWLVSAQLGAGRAVLYVADASLPDNTEYMLVGRFGYEVTIATTGVLGLFSPPVTITPVMAALRDQTQALAAQSGRPVSVLLEMEWIARSQLPPQTLDAFEAELRRLQHDLHVIVLCMYKADGARLSAHEQKA